ncbi:phenylacetate-CoA ligase [Anaerolineales bacterium]|nr:phenylacetate-CoA ligase [Anaerolineales bacterium]
MRITPLDSWVKEKINGADLQAWQLSKLNETLALARGKSAFYKKHFEGLPETLSSLDDLRQFPFTTAEDIRQNPLRFVCVPQGNIQRIVTLQTSGTTGEPKRIFFTAEDQQLTIDFFGVGMSVLTETDERVLIFLPGETPGSVGDLLRMGLERKGRKPIPYGMVKDPFHALDVMESQQADCLVGSPTQILSLARRWNPHNKAPRTILLSTDYVPAAIVNVLENIWGCKVFNHYGTTEMGLGGGVECEAHRGYHLREADMLFEIVNPETGEPVPDGEYGEVVFTTLTRRGMPLIRYRMGDRSRFLVGKCPCGTKLRTMEKIRGRFSGFVRVGDETLKLPDFDEALFPIQGLLNFSVTVSGSGGDEFLLVEAHMLTDEDSIREVERSLSLISSIKNLKVIVHCYHGPKESGNLLKRIIIDKRNQEKIENAMYASK